MPGWPVVVDEHKKAYSYIIRLDFYDYLVKYRTPMFDSFYKKFDYLMIKIIQKIRSVFDKSQAMKILRHW
jgi:hypothetical protein